MACEHKRLKCTNNVFSCLDCGAVLPPDVLQRKPEGQEEKPAEAPKTARKRKTVKADK
jgi:hypothetical protein